MKKILVLVVVLAVSLVGATAALALVAGSQHDLAARGVTGNVSTDVCVNCHTPHGGSTGAGVPPLWNRDLSGDIGGRTGLDVRGSQTCLSCHDGNLSGTLQNVPGIGGANQAATITLATPRANGFFNLMADTTLTNDHPIGAAGSTTGRFGTTDWTAGTALPLFNGTGGTGAQVECATCHDVHNGGGSTNSLFMRAGFACISCHAK